MDCTYHTVGVKGQNKPFLLHLQRAPTPVEANMTWPAPDQGPC